MSYCYKNSRFVLIGKIFSILVTQYLVFFTFIAFWMKDFDHMLYAMKKYVLLDFSTAGTIEIIRDNELPILLMILFMTLHFISYKKGNIAERISKLKIHYWTSILFVFFLSIAMFYVGSAREFIYFQF